MMHVNKGCLARSREDIRSDGSRQEGSHKGWNGLQRSFSSGIEIFTALSHDFVLRRNCRIAYNDKDSNPFTVASNGTHHVRLANHNATLWNGLVAGERDKGRVIDHSIGELPRLPVVASGETFGLVVSAYSSAFKGLLEIKEEVSEEEKTLIDERPADVFDPVEMFKSMNIDPTLVKIPLTLAGSQSQPILLDTNMAPIPNTSIELASTSTIVDLTEVEAPAVRSKRKSAHPEERTIEKVSNPSMASKRIRLERSEDVSRIRFGCFDDHDSPELQQRQPELPTNISTATNGTASQDFFQRFYKPRKPMSNAEVSKLPSMSARPSQAPTTEPQPTVDVSTLHIRPELQNMTRSQRLFSIMTGIDARSLTISSKDEFFLFMDLRAERQWASFRMNPNKLVAETNEFNKRLDQINQKLNLVTVNKHPRALHEMLGKIEQKIIQRLSTNDYKCK